MAVIFEVQDAAGESYLPRFNSEPSSAIISSMDTDIPQFSVLGTANSAFQRSSSVHSWLQHSHIQRDEAELTKYATSDWKKRKWQSHEVRPSASAMALARKCKRDEQCKLLNGKKQCVDSDSSDYNAGDSEQDSLDMEEHLTAFVEYNATDMDSLDINSSEDFDGDDEEQDPPTQVSQQSCSWKDVTNVNQFQDEASEIFDHVIYAPRSSPISTPGCTSIYCRPHTQSEFCYPSFQKKSTTSSEKNEVCDASSKDSEGLLSDGFNVAINLASTMRPAVQSSPAITNAQWRQRRSVKRDCSFIDNSGNNPVNGRLLLMASPASVSTSESDRIIELKDGCFDSSDNTERVSMQHNEVSTSEMTPVVSSSSFTHALNLHVGFQPRVARKRRKVNQQTLDGFFRSKKY